MHTITNRKTKDARKLTQWLLFEEQSSQNPPPYDDSNFTLPKHTDVQQRCNPQLFDPKKPHMGQFRQGILQICLLKRFLKNYKIA